MDGFKHMGWEGVIIRSDTSHSVSSASRKRKCDECKDRQTDQTGVGTWRQPRYAANTDRDTYLLALSSMDESFQLQTLQALERRGS